MTKTVLLLGAGASADAEIPMAVDMVPEVLTGEYLDTEDQGHFRALAQYAHAALAMHMTANGEDARSMDIERLANAMIALGQRERSDLAPFVGSWMPSIERVEMDRNLRSVSGSQSPFDWAFEQVLWSVARICEIRPTDTARVEYLNPLLEVLRRERSLCVATLNYDNSVEMICDQSGVPVLTPGPNDAPTSLNAPPYVELLHLHGAAAWTLATYSGAAVAGRMSIITTQSVEPDGSVYESHVPGLLFGGHNKLRADGPWLSLLMRFQEVLRGATRIVIVGYSFRDDHINALLHKRARMPGTRPDIVICDPSPTNYVVSARINDDIFHHESKVRYVRQSAKVGLRRALFESVDALSDRPWVDASEDG